MIFSILATGALLAIMLYSGAERSGSHWLATGLRLACLFGIYLVWRPQDSTRIASLLGIGRGVDLVLYVWVIVSGLLMIRLRVQQLKTYQDLTTLARKMAIQSAMLPSAEITGIDRSHDDAPTTT